MTPVLRSPCRAMITVMFLLGLFSGCTAVSEQGYEPTAVPTPDPGMVPVVIVGRDAW
jgi:hypothetical protein